MRAGATHDARIEMLHPLGTFVPEGAPVAVVHGDRRPTSTGTARVVPGLAPRPRPHHAAGPSFGFRRLVDIAERALSPGINDPTTAIQAIDELHELLRRLGRLLLTRPRCGATGRKSPGW